VKIKKTIAPVIVSLCLIGYYLSVGIALLKFSIPILVKITILIASIIVPLVIIMVLVERLKEIKGGEEDDLGNY
jgi:ABC-type transport system involved in cytochrome bd biosynthesis fused ATPase/permease subunit